MNRTSIFGIIISVVVASISVDGFIISTRTRLSAAVSPSSSYSSRYATVLDTNNERSSTSIEKVDNTIHDLLESARRLGPVGVRNTVEDQVRIQSIVTRLKQQLEQERNMRGSTKCNYTDIPLVGVHDLIYSAAQGGSSGKIGPYFYGKVTQTFVNQTTFINAVDFGPLNIAFTATRQVKDNATFIVRFHSTTVSVFGIPLIEKSIRGTGGVWKIIYTGIVNDSTNIVAEDGQPKRILLRIMETPSLFIIEQNLAHVALMPNDV